MRRLSFAVVFASASLLHAPAVRPVASVQQIMDAMVIPASNALFDVARQAPSGDEEWAALERQAVLLAESGNLLLMGDRAKGTDVWTKSSQAMVEAGAVALESAEARNVEGVLDAGNQVMDACETCHETHLDKAR